MTPDEVISQLTNMGLDGAPMGERGSQVVQRIECELSIKLPDDMKSFIENVGNVGIGPFLIVFGGVDGRAAIEETKKLNIDSLLGSAFLIMEYAGESTLFVPRNGCISAYDSFYMMQGQELRKHETFSEFLDWVFREAKLMKANRTSRNSSN
jgi:hypothetical protein